MKLTQYIKRLNPFSGKTKQTKLKEETKQKKEDSAKPDPLPLWDPMLTNMRASQRHHILSNAIPVQPPMPRNEKGEVIAMDCIDTRITMDDGCTGPTAGMLAGYGYISPAIQTWYASKVFPGFNMLEVIAQDGLVSRACRLKGQAAVRNGYTITINEADGLDSDGDEVIKAIARLDKKFKVKTHLKEADYFREVFGVRHILFKFEGVDYSQPFNPDGIKAGSYRGMVQIDPQIVMPLTTTRNVSDPSYERFMEPDYFQVYGVKYHHSWFIIKRSVKVAAFMRPSYLYAGISLTQRIYERCYAAERCANEIPQVMMSKRLLIQKVDMLAMVQNQSQFEDAEKVSMEYRDNLSKQFIGLNDEVNQIDTAMTDMDMNMMGQYKIVAAEAEVPFALFMSDSPRGFGAIGEFEKDAWRDTIRSKQEDLQDILDMHHQCLLKSEGITQEIEVVWEPLEGMSPKEESEIRKYDAETAEKYVNMGAISGDSVRKKLMSDKDSEYNATLLEDDEPINPEAEEAIDAAFDALDKEEDPIHNKKSEEGSLERIAKSEGGMVEETGKISKTWARKKLKDKNTSPEVKKKINFFLNFNK